MKYIKLQYNLCIKKILFFQSENLFLELKSIAKRSFNLVNEKRFFFQYQVKINLFFKNYKIE